MVVLVLMVQKNILLWKIPMPYVSSARQANMSNVSPRATPAQHVTVNDVFLIN